MAQLEAAELTLLNESARVKYNAVLAAQETAPESTVLSPTRSESSWGVRAEEYYRDGDVRNAFAAAKKGTDIDPDDAQSWLIYLLAAADLERFDEADFASAELVRRTPGNVDAHVRRGEVLDRLERFPEAEAVFRQAVVLDPSAVYQRVRAAWAVLDQGHTQPAVEEAWQIMEWFPHESSPRSVLRAACEALRTQGRPQDALTVAHHLHNIDPSDGASLEQVILAHHGLADIGAVMRPWNTVGICCLPSLRMSRRSRDCGTPLRQRAIREDGEMLLSTPGRSSLAIRRM